MRRLLRKRGEEEHLTMDDVHRLYGVTMEMAQILETILRGHATQAEYRKLRDDFSSQPFARIDCLNGKTIGWIEKRYKMPEEAHELVVVARDVRNHLAHSFYASIDKHTVDGRRLAIATLLAAMNLFGATGRAVFASHSTQALANEAPDDPVAEPDATFPVVDDAMMTQIIQELHATFELK